MLAVFLLAPAVPAGAAGLDHPSADELVRRSIAHHDPNGVWPAGELRLRVVTTYSDELAAQRGSKTKEIELTLCPGRGRFGFAEGAGDERLVVRIDGETRRLTVGGRSEIPEAERERLRLRPAGFYRDYYEYLYGMPMKLRDPGARIDPTVERATFDGRDALALQVSYDPEVGSDVWTFYFDPATSAIVGYRFLKGGKEEVGETIVLGGEVADAATGFNVPRSQAWYALGDGSFLARDVIVELTVELPQAAGP